MSLNPQDIVRKEFREAFRGYNQADVDLFLDEVVESFAHLHEENQRMKVRIAALQQEVARLRESKGGDAAPATRGGDVERLEAEVRARVRRFLEDQIRALEAPRAANPAVERMTRDLGSAAGKPKADPAEAPRTEKRPLDDRPEAPAEEPKAGPDETPPGTPSREPFWAGE